jgi:hypothetical protein
MAKGDDTKPNSFRALPSWAGRMSALTHVHSELSRLGRDSSSLAPYQQTVLTEMEDGFDEDAISRMFWWWHYDIPRLAAQLDGGGKPEPRIELTVDITSKENNQIFGKAGRDAAREINRICIRFAVRRA